MSRITALLSASLLALATFVIDRVLKRAVEADMFLGESATAVPGVLNLTYIKNPGGAFGLLSGSQLVLLVGSAVAILAVLWMLLAGPPSGLTTLGCGLILGGAAGNLFDRLTAGEVTDYLDLQFWPLERWPIFNAADTAIVIGVLLLLFSAFAGERSGGPAKNPDHPPD